MITSVDPRDLTLRVMLRSICAVQVGAVIEDDHGIFGWGWNHAGPTGLGQHAEVDCLKRSNMKRQRGATLYVASQRFRNAKPVTSAPCERCRGWLEARGINRVWWRGGDGIWRAL